MSKELSRREHAALYGPTTGDAVRLADTDLFAQIERDLTHRGDEAVFGGGKVIRDGMGHNGQRTRDEGIPDTVITNAIIIDYTGIYKADVAIRDGVISAIGAAGNPDIMDDVDIVIGASTEVIAGEHRILTAGGIDSHIHFISPTQVATALASGMTTMIGGGTGPADGTNATTITPGAWNLARMLQAVESFPMNIGLLGKGHASAREPLAEQLRAGAQLLGQRLPGRGVALAQQADVHGEGLDGLEHAGQVPRPGGDRGGVGAVGGSCPSSDHGGHARGQGGGDLGGGDEVNMGVDASGRQDAVLAGDHLRGGADDDVDVVHDVRVARSADSADDAVADGNVGLVDAGVVDDDRVGDDGVGDALVPRALAVVAHTVADDLAASEDGLVATVGQVPLDLGEQVGVGQADGVPSGGTVQGGMLPTAEFLAHDVLLCSQPWMGPFVLPASPKTLRAPASATRWTGLESPGSKRTAVPAGISRRKPRAACRSKDSAELTSAKWKCEPT